MWPFAHEWMSMLTPVLPSQELAKPVSQEPVQAVAAKLRLTTGRAADRAFRLLTGLCAVLVASLLLLAILFMVKGSLPAIRD